MAIDDDDQVRLASGPVRIDTYRASGPGGQHRNTTDSAVRVVDLTTGTTVVATEHRSQHQNRALALDRLHQRLTAHADDQRATHRNRARQAALVDGERAWTWTEWRDTVRGPGTAKGSMRRALRGDLRSLLR